MNHQSFSDINNNSDYFISPVESPKTEEDSLSNEQKDIITSEQSSATEDSIDLDKIVSAEISSLTKVSELHQDFDSGELKADIETIELEKREEVIESAKEERTESNSLEEIFQVAAEPGEITIESKVAEVSQQPLTIGEKVVTSESNEFATSLGSFGLRESSPFGKATSTPSTIPNAFNISGSIPSAFATPPPAFGQVQPQTFGQPSFGQSPQVNAFIQPVFGQTGFSQQKAQTSSIGSIGIGQPAFGQPGFGQPGFGQPAFGQPAFGQTGFGTPVAPTPINTAAFSSNGGGFARFASNTPSFGGSAAGFGKTPTSASTNKPLNISDPTWQARK